MIKLSVDNSGIDKLLEMSLTYRARAVIRHYYIEGKPENEISEIMGLPKVIIVSDIVRINKLIEDNLVRKICQQCGEEYYTAQPQTRICQKCKKANRQEINQAKNESFKSVNAESKPKARKKKAKSISQILRDMEKYNKENGTELTYGKYLLLVGEKE